MLGPPPQSGAWTRATFGPFRLERTDARLWRGEDACHLTPKAFAVLEHLLSRAGSLVTKHDLLETVWPEIAVSDDAMTAAVVEVRRVLGDDARTPHWIATVHRRGFRFIGQVRWDAGLAPGAVLAPADRTWMVGREIDLARLGEILTAAQQGQRRIAFVTGAAGIGKTTVVEASLAGAASLHVARGECLEYKAGVEPYQPVFDAMTRFCRQPGGERALAVLARHAPTWVAQIPGLSGDAELSAPKAARAGTSQHRMLREMANALEALTQIEPLVLVLEDLHWSDHATLDLLATLGRRPEPARLAIVATYRPGDATIRRSPIGVVAHELLRRRLAIEIPLDLLGEADVSRYLALRCPGHRFARTLAQVIHQQTDGNPLFLVAVTDSLIHQSWLGDDGDGWAARPGAEEAARAVPKTLSEMVERQLDAVDARDRDVLDAASVVGPEFSAAAAASGLQADVRAVELECADLARRGVFLQARGSEAWPDGTFAGRYRFLHALYQHVVYERLPPGRRAELHRRIGERLEAAHGARSAEHASELARHFVEGRDPERATHYLQRAAESARARGAYREAIALLTQGLALIGELPATSERARRELDFQSALGPLLLDQLGYASPEVERAFDRARQICLDVGDRHRLVPALWGLQIHHNVRGNSAVALGLAGQLQELATHDGDATAQLLAHLAHGVSFYYRGAFTATLEHLDRVVELYLPRSDEFPAQAVVQHPAISAHRIASWVLWALGYPERALVRADTAVMLARQLGHVPSIVAALVYRARLHQFSRDTAATRRGAEEVIALAREHGFAQRLAAAGILLGWANAIDDPRVGVAAITDALAAYRATGARDDIPYWLALLAEARLAASQPEAALPELAEALDHVRSTEVRVWEAEIHRLTGEARLATGAGDGERALLDALAVAREQAARSLELRAAISLARHWARTPRRDDARTLLAATLGAFTEGFETLDARTARELLDELDA